MEMGDKVGIWLNNLKLFALNAEIHCSREEKAIKQELIGTRHVNLAFDEMVKDMHADFDFQYENVHSDPTIIEGGRQILLFTIGYSNYYTDISEFHEIVRYPSKKYNQFMIKENSPMIGILNWYEGLVPVIQTQKLLGEKLHEENYLLICDIGKEIYAFTVTKIYQKHEIDSLTYGQDIELNDQKFTYVDFDRYENQLIEIRLKLK